MREWSVHSWDYRRVLERLHAEYGATPFFRVTVEPNPRSPNTSSIRISPSGLGLPDRTLYYADPDNKIVNAYKRLLKDIVTLLRATTSEALKFSTDIFYYEKRIAEITPESALLQDPINTYNPISVSELKITAASLPLREILVSMFPNAGITDETEILVSSPDYLTAVSGIVSSTDRSALNNYVIWTLVRVYLPYLPSEYTAELQQYTSELTGVDVPLQRWEVCTDMVQRFMGLAVQAELESRSPISDRASATVHDIFRNVRNAAKDLLSYHHFPTDFLKHIKQKVSSLSMQVGLPKNVTTNIYLKNYYSKLYVQKSNLFQNIFNGFLFLREEQQQRYLNPQLEYRLIPYSSRQSVTARYSASVNTIVVPGALLSLSHFSAGDPKSVMYGRIGMDIASAVVSGLLPWDSSWSGSGQLLSPYRPEVNQSLLATDQLRRCLSASVTQHNLATDHLANITSLSSLKHVFALRLAHNALVFSLKSDAHIHQPTLETYEDAALFFITYAQSQCSRYSPQQELLDNLVEFKLADKILLYVSWWHVPNFSKSLQCAQHETSCSDLL